MNLMLDKMYKNVDAMNPRGGYWEPSIVTAAFFYHKDDHYVKPNRVACKYLDFKKDVDLDVHVKVFNFVIKTNVETSEEYIINVFNYMLKDTTLDWCHNYIS
jgi:hypothetical protein